MRALPTIIAIILSQYLLLKLTDQIFLCKKISDCFSSFLSQLEETLLVSVSPTNTTRCHMWHSEKGNHLVSYEPSSQRRDPKADVLCCRVELNILVYEIYSKITGTEYFVFIMWLKYVKRRRRFHCKTNFNVLKL